MREALNLLVKKGNPVQPATDLTATGQLLVWVFLDADNADKAVVTLTGREAAKTAGYKLPTEFGN